MKEEYGFLCVGQAASNIGVQFERLGYNVLYVNTSSEDLNLLKDSSHKYHVEGGEGCAKDRDKAKALLANDIDTLVDLVRTKLPERLIFVVFASGGGTGSGLSPYLLGVLVEEFGADEYDPEKRFAAVTILPTDKEPLQPAINSYNCCKELYDVDGLGAIFFLDNNTRDNKFTINDEFVKGLDEILNIPERHKSTKGNVDKAEIKKVIFETSGMAAFTVKNRNCSTAPQLIASIKDSIFAPVDTSGTVLYYVFSTTQEIDRNAIFTEFGESLDVFATYNETRNIMLMSGLKAPTERLDKIAKRVQDKSEKMQQALDNSYDNKLTKEIGLITTPKKKKRTIVKEVKNDNGVIEKVTTKAPSAKDLFTNEVSMSSDTALSISEIVTLLSIFFLVRSSNSVTVMSSSSRSSEDTNFINLSLQYPT